MSDYGTQTASSSAVDWARQNLNSGVDSERVVAALMGQGWTELAARQVLDQALTLPVMPVQAQRAGYPVQMQGRPQVMGYEPPRLTQAYSRSSADTHLRNMRNGGILLAIGIAITIGTMSMGGITILAWGPILFGGIRFVTGFFGWIGSR